MHICNRGVVRLFARPNLSTVYITQDQSVCSQGKTGIFSNGMVPVSRPKYYGWTNVTSKAGRRIYDQWDFENHEVECIDSSIAKKTKPKSGNLSLPSVRIGLKLLASRDFQLPLSLRWSFIHEVPEIPADG